MSRLAFRPPVARSGPGRGRRVGAAVAVAAVLVSACGGDDDGSRPVTAERSSVVVTTGIWADVVSNVTCGGVDVETLVPVGADPHGFEPSLRDRGAMEAADLVVANGLGLEERLDDALERVADAGTPVHLVGEHVPDPLDGADHDEVEDDHDHGGADPHVWFDPVRVAEALPALADALVTHAGVRSDAVADCLADYLGEIEALDAEIRSSVEALPTGARQLVTNHDSLRYFADRYGVEIVGTLIPTSSTLAETNPARLEALAAAMERESVGVVVVEIGLEGDTAAALAERVEGAEVVGLHTGGLGGAGSGAETYLDFVRDGATRIVEALHRATP